MRGVILPDSPEKIYENTRTDESFWKTPDPWYGQREPPTVNPRTRAIILSCGFGLLAALFLVSLVMWVVTSVIAHGHK
jgi:hypothetical protein